PGGDPSLARVNLLPAADQADDDGPIRMAIHHRNQELRLGLIEVGDALPPPHEVGGLGSVPGALRFVKDHDMIDWGFRSPQAVIAKVMDVLNELLDRLRNGTLAD